MLVLLYSENVDRNVDTLTDVSGILEDAKISSVILRHKGGFVDAATRCDAIILCDPTIDLMSFGKFIKEQLHLDLPVWSAEPILDLGMKGKEGELEKQMKSWTEIHAPRQTRRFMEIVMKMYRVHLAKNHDYSPANITGPGMIGIATRMWDKIVRIMNLTGFQISAEHLGFEKPRRAVNEPYMDAFMDVSVYGIIAQIFEQGDWGK